MVLECIFGHSYDDPEVEETVEENDGQRVTKQERVRTCSVCGDRDVVGETTQVRATTTSGKAAIPDGGDEPAAERTPSTTSDPEDDAVFIENTADSEETEGNETTEHDDEDSQPEDVEVDTTGDDVVFIGGDDGADTASEDDGGSDEESADPSPDNGENTPDDAVFLGGKPENDAESDTDADSEAEPRDTRDAMDPEDDAVFMGNHATSDEDDGEDEDGDAPETSDWPEIDSGDEVEPEEGDDGVVIMSSESDDGPEFQGNIPEDDEDEDPISSPDGINLGEAAGDVVVDQDGSSIDEMVLTCSSCSERLKRSETPLRPGDSCPSCTGWLSRE